MKSILLTTQLGISVIGFMFLVLVNWYQGSELVSDIFEWKYTAKFSEFFNGGELITSSDQISQLDFFIYSAKHHPLTTGSMFAAFLYVLLSFFFLVQSFKKDKVQRNQI
ncbi:DUF4306 domain-containing protein [Bacillus swezeyi]|uniref:DUF4306 domain-containing protein n=1 Tax=Bacillus swezeyi TaxID=1925020 RepID=A0A1R1QIQ7_9BACI|nr:DUF4306 domain-containing protein [Bacillus swezeyi]MEC1261034.1 DUF4306 domain-containing protein [Bacillus swezeyi]MED2928971.1 DUF4306 domain-containing protein [Bacillus swezeyi]MED2944286.1 DUF4306 domain-containing protein [Bacillus swezeyi]MED2964493.1 DUF4306 domain-containing protein [Bacillus swezeyi]MED2979433.1 DUF4306 domain-containing protein [Bacillus swezeyi]